jgi:hypothetical protein
VLDVLDVDEVELVLDVLDVLDVDEVELVLDVLDVDVVKVFSPIVSHVHSSHSGFDSMIQSPKTSTSLRASMLLRRLLP